MSMHEGSTGPLLFVRHVLRACDATPSSHRKENHQAFSEHIILVSCMIYSNSMHEGPTAPYIFVGSNLWTV